MYTYKCVCVFNVCLKIVYFNQWALYVQNWKLYLKLNHACFHIINARGQTNNYTNVIDFKRTGK